MNQYKLLFIIFILTCSSTKAQKLITDPYITLQEKRMVYHSWADFRPSKGFLGLNPHYLLTWGILANLRNRRYRNGPDIRPLKPSGTQNLRYASLVATGQEIEGFSEISSSLAINSSEEYLHISGLIANVDPLWNLYYKRELSPLLNYNGRPLDTAPERAKETLKNSNSLHWYNEQMHILKERLEINLKEDINRGARIMGHHRILLDFIELQKKWTNILQEATKRTDRLHVIRHHTQTTDSIRISWKDWTSSSDQQIMREVISKARLK